jgi:hypothetical protein
VSHLIFLLTEDVFPAQGLSNIHTWDIVYNVQSLSMLSKIM